MRKIHRWFHAVPVIVAAILSPPLGITQPAENLDFLQGLPDGRHMRGMLSTYLRGRAGQLLDERRRKVESLATASDVALRKAYVRERMQLALGGPFPARTPLNARVTGVLERPAYRIEKIVFESQPRFYVTANLYIPKGGRPPYPAILFPLGHEAGAKAHTAWQYVLGSLATKGFVALAWEPVGQGERIQLWDEDFKESKLVRSTTEHTVIGAQCLLLGDNLARYTVFDGLRALDYLLSRKEVDPGRIGLTGNSGGGTHTAYIAALDDRIHVAAPSCYITSWQRLLETIGPQDAEQSLPPSLADGLDHADFLYAFAPKPFLMLTAMRDFFSITGARETFGEARRVYDVAGGAGKLDMFEADDGHGYTKPRRLAAYRWFTRWLQGVDQPQTEPEIELATEEELLCTETGQVATAFGGETVVSLNRRRLEEVRRGAAAPSLDAVRVLTGFEKRTGPLPVRDYGRFERAGYRIEKLVYESEPGISIPALLWLPEGSGRRPAAVYVHPRGKAEARADVEPLVKAGLIVLAIDARGWGETRSDSDRYGSDWPRYFGDYESAMTALLVAKPLVAMRAADVSRGVDLLAARAEVDPGRIGAIGRDAGALPTLYAAAFDARIRSVALERMLVSYESVVQHRVNRQVMEGIVVGALRSYDLPDLVGWLAPRSVSIVDPVDPVGMNVPLAEANRSYARASAAFARAGAPEGLRIARRRSSDTPHTLYPSMLP